MSPLKPALYCKPGGVLSLSGSGLQEFLKAVLAKGARFRFRARGLSMNPFIQDGDVLTIFDLDGRVPQPGEVVAFCHPVTQKLVVHRVLSKLPGGYLIRGDSASEGDGFIPSKNIFGTVSRVERESQQVRLGLGPERRLIAWLSRHNLLQSLIHWSAQVLRPALNRLPK